MTPATLRGWRKSLAITQTEAAIRLGVSLRTIQEWEAGRTAAPKIAALACAAVSLNISPIKDAS